MDNDIKDLLKLKAQQKSRARSHLIAPYSSTIKEMIDLDISLPLIKGWLKDKKGVAITLQTLRNFVIRDVGDQYYEAYCKRNGWMKTKRKPDGCKTKKKEVGSEVQGNSGAAAEQKQAPTAAPGENPLRALSGKLKEGDYNPIPTAKFEVDNS